MPESSDVSAGQQATAVQYNALRDDALRAIIAQGIGDSETLISTGALTISSDNIGFVTVGAEGGTADDLLTMTGTGIDNGDVVVLKATAGDTITIKADASPAANEFNLPDDRDIILEGDLMAAFLRVSGYWEFLWINRIPIASVQVPLGGSGGIIPDGEYRDFRWLWDATLIATAIMADESGTIRVEHWHDTWANFPPDSADEIGNISLSSAQKDEDTSLAGYTDKTFEKGEVSKLYVDGDATTIKQVTVELIVIIRS